MRQFAIALDRHSWHRGHITDEKGAGAKMGRSKPAVIGVGLLAATAIGVGVVQSGTASGLLFSPTTTTAYVGHQASPSGQRETDQQSGGGATTNAANTPVAGALAPLLGSPVRSVTQVIDNKSNYLDLDARRTNGKGFVVTIYRNFQVGELANLTHAAAHRGVAWVGAEDADLTSIYYRSTSGVGVWVGYYAPDGRVKSVASLTKLAARLAALPAVAAEAAR